MNKLYDERIAKLENTGDDVMWGNYDHTYDWFWTNDRPCIIPIHSQNTAQVLIRDWNVAWKLKELGIKKVLDIGSDTGHFMAVLSHLGIEAVGIDANKKSCDMVNSKGVNHCYHVGLQTLIKQDISKYDCIVCMNFTHAPWKDEQLKINLVNWMARNGEYLVLSDYTHQDRKWGDISKVYDFNFLRFYCSRLFVRIASFLGFGALINYPCIQKLYKSKINK